jgi:hypothetical protein
MVEEVPKEELAILAVTIPEKDADRLTGEMIRELAPKYPTAIAKELPDPYAKAFSSIELKDTLFFIDRKGVIDSVMTGKLAGLGIFGGSQRWEDLHARAIAPDYAGEVLTEIRKAPSELSEPVEKQELKSLWSVAVPEASGLCAGDWDGDGNEEILVVDKDGSLSIISVDGVSGRTIKLKDKGSSIAVGRRGGESRLLQYEIRRPRVTVYNPEGLPLWTYQDASAINGAYWGDLDGDGSDEMIVGNSSEGGLDVVGDGGSRLLRINGRNFGQNHSIVRKKSGESLIFATAIRGGVKVFDEQGNPKKSIRPVGSLLEETNAQIVDGADRIQLLGFGIMMDERDAGEWVIAFDETGRVAWRTVACGYEDSTWQNATLASGDADNDGIPEWAFFEKGQRLCVASVKGERLAALPPAKVVTYFTLVNRKDAGALLVTMCDDVLTAYALEKAPDGGPTEPAAATSAEGQPEGES